MVRLSQVNEVEDPAPRGLRQAIDVPPFGELADPRVLAGLAAAAEERGWDGFFVWDHITYRAPVRAVAALAELTSQIRKARPAGEPFDVIVDIPPGDDPTPWARAGATWTVTDLGRQPTQAQVREVINAGPDVVWRQAR